MISRIDGPRPLSATAPTRKASKTSRASGSSFSKHLDEAEEVSGASGAVGVGSITGVLDIQEVDDALERAARGKVRAEELLSKLDDLRLDILSGTISKNKLQKLSELVNSKKLEISDPKLSEILDQIDLRAQVELAKFTRTL
ncbi:MAG: flagellar assembly protein FliX [Proteobacteria bacterium]|jgi:hypothetical protein|nr:flagellar assembly protein FliX [Alphaproteobacteria bacterium]NCC03529.1 flagellar assembly protein FliX [Pseudomonadota bacterium]